MPLANQLKWLLITGWVGLIGAILMLLGDLLLYTHFENMPAVEPTVRAAFPARQSILLAGDMGLGISALLGPIAGIFYLVGSLHFALLFNQKRAFGAAVALMSALAFVASGAYHTQFSLLAYILKYANSTGVESQQLVNATQSILYILNIGVQIPWVLAFSALFSG